jgi:hypothetical protein
MVQLQGNRPTLEYPGRIRQVSIGTRAPKLLQQEATSTRGYFNKRLPQQKPTSTSTKRYFNILSTGADDRTLPQLKSQGTMLNYGYIKNEFDVHMRTASEFLESAKKDWLRSAGGMRPETSFSQNHPASVISVLPSQFHRR